MRWARDVVIGLAAAALLLAAGFVLIRDCVKDRLAPDPETIVSASLQGMREQNRLSTFAARYVAVVTSTEQRLGVFSAKKTLIMPGMVRYEVDLAKLGRKDLKWNADSHTLTVTLPPVEVVGPQVDLNAVKEYDGGGILLALTDAGRQLDEANRKAAQAELLRQAKAPLPMKLARDATRRAIERSFALPLRAAGLDAKVEARFADEDSPPMDRSRSLDEVYGQSTGK